MLIQKVAVEFVDFCCTMGADRRDFFHVLIENRVCVALR